MKNAPMRGRDSYRMLANRRIRLFLHARRVLFGPCRLCSHVEYGGTTGTMLDRLFNPFELARITAACDCV